MGINEIERGKRKRIRVPGGGTKNPGGYDLAHPRGKEARYGNDYSESDLQVRSNHRLQHQVERRGGVGSPQRGIWEPVDLAPDPWTPEMEFRLARVHRTLTYRIRDKEFEAILGLPGPRRYEHFVKRCADWEEVWGLANPGGWAEGVNDDGRALFYVWPHLRYAEACAQGPWDGYTSQRISLCDWMNEYLPRLRRGSYLVAVLADPAGGSVQVEPERLCADLLAELSLYED